MYINVTYSRPSGWTDWADIFCGHSWVAGERLKLKKFENIFFKIIIFLFQLVFNVVRYKTKNVIK